MLAGAAFELDAASWSRATAEPPATGRSSAAAASAPALDSGPRGDQHRVGPPPRRSIVLTLSHTISPPQRASVSERERPAARMAARAASRVRAGPAAPRRADRAVLEDPVLDVDEPDGAEREAAVGHHRHLQRKGEHVRVGAAEMRRAGYEAADLGVGRDALGVAAHVRELQLQIGHLAAAARDERQQRRARDHRAGGARIQRRQAGRARERAPRHLRPPAGSGRRRARRCR